LAQIPVTRGELAALRADHLPQAVSLSAALGWPYREEDWRIAFELGHGVVVETERGLAATALWWPYGKAFASFGMIIVAPALQGRGIGRLLMDELLRQAEGRAIVLNSTREGYRLYERLGFVPCGQVNQHQAVLAAASPESPAGTTERPAKESPAGREPPAGTNRAIRPLRPEDIGAIRDLDCRASGMQRTRLLDALFAVGKVAVIAREGRVQGYACVRRWGRGVVVGPVIARDAADAKVLVAALATEHRGDFVRIDVPATSGLSSWLEAIGLPQVDQVVSMVRGKPPMCAADATLFALSNQSLG
jgi:predicted N-acetyltransferase YhbS